MVFYKDNVKGGYKMKLLPFIVINKEHKGDKGLLVHEITHVYQYFFWFVVVGIVLLLTTNWLVALVGAISTHDLLYTLVRPYRQYAEVTAFKRQLRVGGSIEVAAKALARDYNLKLTYEQALTLLR